MNKGDPVGYEPHFRAAYLGPRYWPTWLLLALMRFGHLLPRRLWGWVGAGFGELYYRLSRKRRDVAQINVDLCFPEMDRVARGRLVRRHFRVYAQCLLDMGLVWWARPAFLEHYIKVEGLQYYRAAREEGRSVILLTGHFSGLDLAGPMISRHYPQVGLIKPAHNRLVDWLLARGRRRFAGRVYLRDKGLRPVVRALRSGYGFYYLPDEDFGPERSVFVPFLGTVAATITALSRLARMSGAVVLPTSVERVSSHEGYCVRIGPPLADFPGEDEREDAARMNAALGEMVRRAPEQYMWTFKYFRTRPGGEVSPYVR